MQKNTYDALKTVAIVKNTSPADFPKATVAEIRLEAGNISLGDELMIQGPTTGVVEQQVSSLQIQGKNVKMAKKGISVGVLFKKKVRKNDRVYVISS